MAQEIRQFTALIPAGTLRTAPLSFEMGFPPREVETVEIRVPPGPSGLVGFALQLSGITVIPYQSDAFIVTAADYLTWPMHGYPNSGDWSLLGYNEGTADHAVYVRFLLGYIAQPLQVASPMLDDSAIMDLNTGLSEGIGVSP